MAHANAAQEHEESVYVVLDLPDLDYLPLPGSRLQLQGMETQQPALRLADGTQLVGSFEETVGMQLILAHTSAGSGGRCVQLVSCTDKRISFAKAPGDVPASREDAVGGGAAGTAAAAATGQQQQPPQPPGGPS